MTRNTRCALLLVAVVVGSGLALPATAALTSSDGATHSRTVVVHNAQVGQLQLDNSTVQNVTIQTLRIDRVTLRNQSNDQLNETLGGGTGPVTLHNVYFQNISLQNVSADGLQVAGTTDTQQVGNVSGAVIDEMTVDHLVVEQSTVGGGVFAGIIGRIRGLFGGGQQAPNESAMRPDLRVSSVDVSRLTVDRLDVTRVQRVEPGQNQTGSPSGPAATQTGSMDNATTLGRVSVENATVGTLSADVMRYQHPGANETQQAGSNATGRGP